MAGSKGFFKRKYKKNTKCDMHRSMAVSLFNKISKRSRTFPVRDRTLLSTYSSFKAKIETYNEMCMYLGTNLLKRTIKSTAVMLPTGITTKIANHLKPGMRAAVFDQNTENYLVFFEPSDTNICAETYEIGKWKLHGLFTWINKSSFLVDHPLYIRYSPLQTELTIRGATFRFN